MKKKNLQKIRFATVRQAEKIAKDKIRKGTFRWLQAAAEDGYTHEKNILDLNRLRIIPKHLTKVLKIKINSSFFGAKIKSPLILSPMGHQTQFHNQGEIEMAKGVNLENSISFFGTQGRMSLKDIRSKNKYSKIGWTIFPFGDHDWIFNQIKSAEKYKCVAICICVDANIRSHRYLDRETLSYDARKYGKRTNPQPPAPELALKYDWSLIKKIRNKTKLPIVIKGILTSEDALNSIKCGADAIWISNHGGRMLNSGISGVEALTEIRKKIKKNKIKIIVDGGVRRGSDILKYLCLGADYIGIGRPAMYGLICNGYLGVREIYKILNNELFTAMINGGFKNLKSFNKSRIKFDEKK